MCEGDDGQHYNVNADTAAMAVAQALGAEKLVFLSDVNGVRRDKNDPDTIIHTLSSDEATAVDSRRCDRCRHDSKSGSLSGDARSRRPQRFTSSMVDFDTRCCWKYSPPAAWEPKSISKIGSLSACEPDEHHACLLPFPLFTNELF